MSVLVIAPHADDEVFGCGGTIARRVSEGHEVHLVVASIGDVSRTDGSLKVRSDVRRSELAESCRRLGVASHVVLFEGMENRLDTLPRMEILSPLDRLLERRAWDEVLFPGPSCHQDHDVVRRVTIAALRQRPGRKRERLSAQYEYPQATWSNGPDDTGMRYVSLGRHLETKLFALAAYASQAVPEAEPLSIEGVRRLALLRGIEVGVESAERFRILREFQE